MDKKIVNCTTEEEIKKQGWKKYGIIYRVQEENLENKKPNLYVYLSKDERYFALFFAEKNNKVRFKKLLSEKE